VRIKLNKPKVNPRWSSSSFRTIAPGDRNQNTDHELLQHLLVDIDEVAALDEQAREGLVDNLVHAVGHRRAGVRVGKRGVSDIFISNAIFHEDVARALEAAGLAPTVWSRKYGDGHESLTDRVARAVGEVCNIHLPRDTKRIVSVSRTIKVLGGTRKKG
jgi:hypothetical protein